jgi:predicted SAM-dependent methyltransferase
MKQFLKRIPILNSLAHGLYRTINYVDYNPDDGKINRSSRFDERNNDGSLNYTSLILDACKDAG